MAILVSLPIAWTEYLFHFCGNTLIWKKDYLNHHAEMVDTLVLGSSSTYFGIAPRYLSANGFNLAFVSQDIIRDVAITSRYLDRMSKLKRVVVGINYIYPYYVIEQGIEKWRAYGYFQAYGLPPLSFPDWLDVRMVSAYYLREKTGPFTAQVLREAHSVSDLTPQALLSPNGAEFDGAGIEIGEPSVAADNFEKSASVAMERHDPMIRQGCQRDSFARNLRELGKLLRQTSANGVRTYFVTLPVTNAYFRRERPEIRQGVRRFLSVECEGIPRCEVFDWETRYLERPELFADADHLNADGRTALSISLGETIRRFETKDGNGLRKLGSLTPTIH